MSSSDFRLRILQICVHCFVINIVLAEMAGEGEGPLYGFLTPSDGSGGLTGVWRGFTDTSTSHGLPHIRRVAGKWLPACVVVFSSDLLYYFWSFLLISSIQNGGVLGGSRPRTNFPEFEVVRQMQTSTY